MSNTFLSVCSVGTAAMALAYFIFQGNENVVQGLDEKRTYDDMKIYEQRIEEFNEKYGTDYAIPPTTALGGSYSEIVDFYTSMTLEELDNYLMSIYDGSIYSSDDESIKETGSVTCDNITLIE